MSEFAIRMSSGVLFDLANPRPEDVRLQDIVYHLAGENRWSAGTRLSVAQHSVNVAITACKLLYEPSQEIYAITHFVGLMHDAHEAYTRDIARPMKRLIPEISRLCERVQDAVATAFRADPALAWHDVAKAHAAVLQADNMVCEAEGVTFIPGYQPQGPIAAIDCSSTWMPAYAEITFRQAIEYSVWQLQKLGFDVRLP